MERKTHFIQIQTRLVRTRNRATQKKTSQHVTVLCRIKSINSI